MTHFFATQLKAKETINSLLELKCGLLHIMRVKRKRGKLEGEKVKSLEVSFHQFISWILKFSFYLAQDHSVDVNWTKLGKTEKIPISSIRTHPIYGTKCNYYCLKYACTSDRKFWDLPDISMTDEEDLDEEHVITFTVPEDFIQFERDELMEMRLHPLSLRPLNLPPLDCVKAYHRE